MRLIRSSENAAWRTQRCNVRSLSACGRADLGRGGFGGELGAPGNRDASGHYLPVYEHCRAQTLLCAAAAGIQAIDTVTVDFRDDDGLQRDCECAASLVLPAKLSIHPNQIDAINAAFTPSTSRSPRREHS